MFTCVAIRCIPIGTTRLRLGGVMSNLFFSRPQQSGRHATHGWLVKFLEHRIADRRVVRLIQKWLNAGVLEDGTRTWSETGTPQRVQCIAPAGECLSALCVRPLGPAVAADAGSRRGHRRALCGRLCATTPVTPTPNALGSSRRFARHSSISSSSRVGARTRGHTRRPVAVAARK